MKFKKFAFIGVMLIASLFSQASLADQTIWQSSTTASSSCAGSLSGTHYSLNPSLWCQRNINIGSFSNCEVAQCANSIRNCGSGSWILNSDSNSASCSVTQFCEVYNGSLWHSKQVTWSALNWTIKAVCSDDAEVNLVNGTCVEPEAPPVDKEKGNSCNNVGNPCNAATGNKYTTEVDFTSPQLSFYRTYNSLREDDAEKWDSPVLNLGVGWGSPYQKRLNQAGFYITIVDADGRGEQWVKQGDVWVGQADSRYTSIAEHSNGYTVKLKDGTKETYSRDGRLLWEKTAWGLKTSYKYSQGLLEEVKGPFGHKLVFNHDSDKRLSRIILPSEGDLLKSDLIKYHYDQNDNLIKVDYINALPSGSVVQSRQYLYEDTTYPNHLTGIIDETGTRISTYAYDSEGRAILSERTGLSGEASQKKLTFSYDTDTQTTVTDGLGNQVIWKFAEILGEKRLTQKTFVTEGATMLQQYDDNGSLLKVTDENGIVTRYEYNSHNQLKAMYEADKTTEKRRTLYSYQAADLDLIKRILIPSTKPGKSRRIWTVYGGKLQIVSTEQNGYTNGKAQTRRTRFKYNSDGLVREIDGPRKDVDDIVTMTYYECNDGIECGQLKTTENALGHLTTYDSYDAYGHLLQMTDARGNVHTYVYDFRGRLLSSKITTPSNIEREQHYTYDAIGRLLTATTSDDITLTYEYDADYLISITDNLGNKTSYDYDLKGNRTETAYYDGDDQLSYRIQSVYDSRDRISSINNLNTTTQYVRDDVGNIVEETDPNQHKTSNTYDALNRVTQKLDALNNLLRYSYDVQDNLTKIETETGLTFENDVDDFGNITREFNSDRGELNYSYDESDNLIKKTDAIGNETTYHYDQLNRLIMVDRLGETEDVSYEYDTCQHGLGLVCQITDNTGVTQFTYDEWGNTTSVSKTQQDITYTTAYTYDDGNRVASITYPSGRVIHYQRDEIGRIINSQTEVDSNVTDILNGRTYGYGNQIQAQTWGNGLEETRSYDQRGWLTNIDAAPVFAQSYDFDANGNITEKTSNEDNLLSGDFGTGNYHYQALSSQLTQQANKTQTRDSRGNLTKEGNRDYFYNQAGRLSEIQQNSFSVVQYQYDHLSRRVQKHYPTQDNTVLYHYDLANRLIAETDKLGNTLTEYIWIGSIPFAQVQNDQITYLITDHLGTPRIGMDVSQQVIWKWTGDTFGSSFAQEDVDNNGQATQVNLRFPGQYYDSETGFHYNWNRYYDPKQGRYITSDPIGLDGGINTYSYALQNPVGYSDPLGLDVYLCGDPAFGWMPVDHKWIKTDIYESGMAAPGDDDAGNNYQYYGVEVETSDHSGRSMGEKASCSKVEGVDEDKVNKMIRVGQPLGRWWPTNQCQSFAYSVIENARTPEWRKARMERIHISLENMKNL